MGRLRLSDLVMVFLLLVHAGLVLWAAVGLIEWRLPTTPWPAISNPKLPPGILLLQWLLVLVTAGIFIAGFVLHWRFTPLAMAVGYAAMASLCGLQTFNYLDHSTKFFDMTLEYAAYLLILLFLFRAPAARRRFRGEGAA